MKDFQIRNLLRRTELSQFINDSHSKVVEEMKIPVAKARIDMAVINGAFHGYEIKGSSDTLKRLPNQLIAYSYIFDYLIIVTEEKYCKKIESLLPDWVGIAVCSNEENQNEFEIRKAGFKNLNKQSFYLAKLLWRLELIEVLKENQIPFKSKDRTWVLCETLSKHIEVNTLSDIVREKLKLRTNWKDQSSSVSKVI